MTNAQIYLETTFYELHIHLVSLNAHYTHEGQYVTHKLQRFVDYKSDKKSHSEWVWI